MNEPVSDAPLGGGRIPLLMGYLPPAPEEDSYLTVSLYRAKAQDNEGPTL
jgi:hypothetical protein